MKLIKSIKSKKKLKMKKFILLLLFAAIIGSCNRSTEVEATKSDPCAEAVQIARLQAELECCQNENVELRLRLEECLEGYEMKKITTKKTSTTSRSTVKKPTVVIAPTKKVSVVKTPVATITKSATKSAVTPGTANLDYLRQGGEILFCVRANGREDAYFPHYAMQQGVQFNRYIDNQVKGYNWRVEPTDFYDGDYGVTVDGTFYVSNGIIEQSLLAGGQQNESIMEIKAPYTGWSLKSMTLEDGFWIYRTQ
jgi:hypothetical protein